MNIPCMTRIITLCGLLCVNTLDHAQVNTETVGPTYRNPRLNHRWSNYIMLAGNLGPTFQFQFTSYLQPRIDRFRDAHMLQSLIASFKIIEHLTFTLTAEIQTDIEPPPTIEPIDLRLTPGLSLQW